MNTRWIDTGWAGAAEALTEMPEASAGVPEVWAGVSEVWAGSPEAAAGMQLLPETQAAIAPPSPAALQTTPDSPVSDGSAPVAGARFSAETPISADSLRQGGPIIPADSLPPVDSLEAVPAAAPPAAFRNPLFPRFEPAPAGEPQPRYREAAPAEVFGASSVQVPPSAVAAAPRDPLATPAYGGAALFLLLLYATLLYRHFGDAGRLAGRLQRDRSTEKRLYEDAGSSYVRFLTICCTLGIFAASLAVVRFAAPLLPPAFVEGWPRTAAALATLGVAAALALSLLYQRGVTFVVGVLTYSQPLIERLWLVKRHAAAMLTVAATPPLLLLLLLPPGTGRGWLWMIIIELSVLSVLYLRETLMLFLAKKVSILHWFLYLCVVEILPLSLWVLLAGRYAL